MAAIDYLCRVTTPSTQPYAPHVALMAAQEIRQAQEITGVTVENMGRVERLARVPKTARGWSYTVMRLHDDPLFLFHTDGRQHMVTPMGGILYPEWWVAAMQTWLGQQR